MELPSREVLEYQEIGGRGGRELRRPRPPTVAAASLVAFSLVAAAVLASARVEAWDTDVNRWVGDDQPGFVAGIALQATAAGGGVALLAVALVGAGVLLRLRRPADALLVALALPLTQVTTNLLKLVFERPRPPVQTAELELSSYAFPSGHASVSMAVYGALALVILRQRRWRASFAVLLPAGILIIGVAMSRVALGAHYPTDVVAGLALGAACLSACVAATQRLRAAEPS